MFKLIGGMFKFILSPLISFIMSLLYGLLIRGPLKALNYIDLAFQKLSGTNVDKLLFSTSISDGKTNFNFFTSDSPLKIFFLIILGISATLLALFLGLIVVKSISGKGQGPIKKMGNIFLSGSIVFAIPMMFLITLSLSGSVLSAINGQNIEISAGNIENFKKDTVDTINLLRTSQNRALKFFDDEYQLTNMQDETGAEVTMSLGQIYNNLTNEDTNWVDSNSQIMLTAQESQEAFFTIKKALVEYDSTTNKYVINQQINNQLINVTSIINSLEPKIKDENMASEIKKLQNSLQEINDYISRWRNISFELMQYESHNSTTIKNIALANFRRAFNQIYGQKNDDELVENMSIETILDLNQEMSNLIIGKPSNPGYGLIQLHQQLSEIKENSLVVTFYQVATGNNDSNWDRSIGDFNNDGFMLIIGFCLIFGACLIMTGAALFAVTRIFDLALLFIVSPAVVTLSALDDGARMKTWINMVIAKLISIYGIVISLRIFGTLNDIFKNMIDLNNSNGDQYMLNLFLLSLFGLGGMLAAYRSSQTLSSIVGAGYGIMEGMQARQIGNVIMHGGKKVGRSVNRIIGLNNNSGNNASGKNPTTNRSRIGNVAEAWKNRSAKLNNAIAKTSMGKWGSTRAKSDYAIKQSQKQNAKLERKISHSNFRKENNKIDKEKYQVKKSEIKPFKTTRKRSKTNEKE